MTEVFPSFSVVFKARVTLFFLFVTFPSLGLFIVSSSVSFLFPPLEGSILAAAAAVVVVVAFIGGVMRVGSAAMRSALEECLQ